MSKFTTKIRRIKMNNFFDALILLHLEYLKVMYPKIEESE